MLGAATASVVLVPARDGDGTVDVVPGRHRPGCRGRAGRSAGQPRPDRGGSARSPPSGSPSPPRQFASLSTERVRQVAVALSAAERAGGARWCLETASEYAKVRRQFGRPIGQFQAVKHRLADMLVRVEQITAVAWDAALAAAAGPSDEAALACAAAGAVVFDGVRRLRQGLHPAPRRHRLHLGARRAPAPQAGPGRPPAARRYRRASGPRWSTSAWPAPAVRSTPTSPRRRTGACRAGAGLRRRCGASRARERRRALVDAGLVVPHWPHPWGRDANAVEQVVIDQELAAAGVVRPHIGVGAWALPVIIAHGTRGAAGAVGPPDPARRAQVVPALLGAGGRVRPGQPDHPGRAGRRRLAPQRPEGLDLDGPRGATGGSAWPAPTPSVPKHDGITYFIVDMRSPGLDIRPLREITGDAMFNEVFIDDVFVPDDCVIGAVGDGWKHRPGHLGQRAGVDVLGVDLRHRRRVPAPVWPTRQDAAGRPRAPGCGSASLLAEAQSLGLMAHRSTLRTLAGTDPGPGVSVRKLLGAEHEQRVQEMGLVMFGPEGAAIDGHAERWAHGFLVTRCLTIAGGTSEIQRNIIAERLLGLPRDPEPGA